MLVNRTLVLGNGLTKTTFLVLDLRSLIAQLPDSRSDGLTLAEILIDSDADQLTSASRFDP
mgnify:CR=1 FL=1|jgi:hypothetical protein